MVFQQPIGHMATYLQRCSSAARGFDIDIAKEMFARLRQLAWLYDNVTRLEKRVIDRYQELHGPLSQGTNVVIVFSTKDSPDDPTAQFTIPEQLCVFGEAFYECAHRLLTILDECKASLPGLRPPAAAGVRRVRNNLVVHANKKGGTPMYTFSVSNAAGLRLRPASKLEEPGPYLDEGLRANAAELSSQLSELLSSTNAA
jgi:hypothetical protein